MPAHGRSSPVPSTRLVAAPASACADGPELSMLVFGKSRLSRSPAVEGYPSGIVIPVASGEGVLGHPGSSSLTLAPEFCQRLRAGGLAARPGGGPAADPSAGGGWR